MTDVRASQLVAIIPDASGPLINVSQVAAVALQEGSITPALRTSQLAVVTVSFEPNNAAYIRGSSLVSVAVQKETPAAQIQLAQLAIVVACQQLPWVPIHPPISLPNYLFSAIPFYVKR